MPNGNTIEFKLLNAPKFRVFVDMVQLREEYRLEDRSTHYMYSNENFTNVMIFKVVPNILVEICVYCNWSNPDSETVNYNITM